MRSLAERRFGPFRRATDSACLLLAFLFLSYSAHALAQVAIEARWGIDSEHWSGASHWAEVLRERGHAVEELERAELPAPRAGDVLVLLSPGAGVERRAVAAWTGLGGGLVLADDRPRQRSLFGIYGVRTRAAPPCPAPRLLERCALPVASRTTATGRVDGVEMLALNRPAVLVGDGVSLFELGDGSSVVRWVESRDGSNQVALVSDPSVFINLMLPVLDNQALAVGLTERACGGEACHVRVVSGSRELRASAELLDRWQERSPSVWRRVERALERAFGARVTEVEARWLAALLGLMALAQLALSLPLRRPAWVRPAVRVPRVSPRGEFETMLRRQQRDGADRSSEAAILARVWREIVTDPAFYPTERSRSARRRAAAAWARRYCPSRRRLGTLFAQRRYERLLAQLERAPTAGTFEPYGAEGRAFDLRRLFDDLLWALQRMELDERLTERTRRPE